MVQQIQALEWMANYSDLTSGTYDNVIAISCIGEGDVVCHFKNGDETKSFTDGMDRTLNGESITISSGTFDINVR